jgi:CRISPR system Cascade subunit CasE
MHLTRFEINTARRGAKDLLRSPQRLHAAVLAAFPYGEAGTSAAGRVLWRLDQHDRQALLYLVSPTTPDLTHLVEQAGWPSTQSWDTRDYTPLLARLGPGDEWGFRLRANPIFHRATGPGKRGQRLGHVTVGHQTEWLRRQTERHGFEVVKGVEDESDVAVTHREILKFHRQDRLVTVATAVFQGRLRITDPDAFRSALTTGIGPAKAYGCGLLTIAPVR